MSTEDKARLLLDSLLLRMDNAALARLDAKAYVVAVRRLDVLRRRGHSPRSTATLSVVK